MYDLMQFNHIMLSVFLETELNAVDRHRHKLALFNKAEKYASQCKQRRCCRHNVMMQSCVQFIIKGILVSEKTEINAVGSGKSGCVQQCESRSRSAKRHQY